MEVDHHSRHHLSNPVLDRDIFLFEDRQLHGGVFDDTHQCQSLDG